MAKEVKFNIKLTVDGKEQLVTASADVRHVASCGIHSWWSDIWAPHVRRWWGLAVPVQHAAGGSRSVVSCCS